MSPGYARSSQELQGLDYKAGYHDSSHSNSHLITWASYQIRKIAGCACAGNAGNIFPATQLLRKPLVSDPDMHHGTCVTHVPWCMSGSPTRGDGKTFPAFPAHAQPAILPIWQEAHATSSVCGTIQTVNSMGSVFMFLCGILVNRFGYRIFLPRICEPGQSETIFFLAVISQLLWWPVGWELPGYFRLIFHFYITRFNNSVTHEISVTIRFLLCETTMACFLLGRLFKSVTVGIVLVVSSDMQSSVSPQNNNP